MEAVQPHDFTGTERFALVRCLGQGGMGAVYEVFDRERGARVALKTLLRAELPDIQRLKREFRSLSGISHPNLVQLYELGSEGSLWFFTMDLIEGSDVIAYLRPARSEPIQDFDLQSGTVTLPSVPPASEASTQAVRFDRLRAVFADLGEALSALHAADKLHRDIKPSNMLVTRDGRLVLLDFGLVTDSVQSWVEHSTMFRTAGTPGYMSPEQFRGEALTHASDWYSVGLVLYQALTGQVPHLGQAKTLFELARLRQEVQPAPPSAIWAGAPEEIEELCVRLLRADPRERPSPDEYRKVFRPVSADSVAPLSQTAFVGRQRELAEMASALARSLAGQCVVQLVHGASGMGKTALLQHFLDRETERGRAVVLRGRCYERESVPYKALDSLIDELCGYWNRLPAVEAEGLVPLEVGALVRLFPAFQSVRTIAKRVERNRSSSDPRELRRSAMSALRELLLRITDRVALILWIDDVQWGDLDSARLLSEMFSLPEPPACLLILSARTEDRASTFLRSVFAAKLQAETPELEIAPLSESAARALAAALLPFKDAQLCQGIARESGGSPFIVAELSRYVVVRKERLREEGRSSVPLEGFDLRIEHALRARLGELTEDAARLLQIVALASGPISETVACEAAEVRESSQKTVLTLENGRLIRTSSDTGGSLEPYHDRIREAVIAAVDPVTQKALHSRLAHALQGSPDADPEALAYHFRSADDLVKAREYARQAAEQASRGLAFDRAVRLCRLALELLEADDPMMPSLRVALAEALCNLGRSLESAEVFLQAAASASAESARKLRQRAAEQLILSGHVDRGLAVINEVLKSLGLKVRASRHAALLDLLWMRLRLRVHGDVFEPRTSEPPPELLTRVDTYWGVGLYMSSIDPLRGAYFQAQNLFLSLKSGHPARIARGLTVEASYLSVLGKERLGRVATLLEAARVLSERLDDPYLLAILNLAEGIVAFMAEERWAKCGELCRRCDAILRENCRSVTWELSNSKFFALNSLLLRGQLAALSEELPEALSAAQANSDLFTESFLSLRCSPTVWLAHDDLGEQWAELARLPGKISAREFYLPHYWERNAAISRALYLGEPTEALRTLEACWHTLERSMLMRMQFHRIEILHLRARCRVACAAEISNIRERGRILQLAERDAGRLEAENTARSVACACTIRAASALLRGEPDRARARLHRAADGFDAADMALYAAVVRWSYGRLVAGDRGRTMVEESESWMLAQGIKKPEQIARLFGPGLSA